MNQPLYLDQNCHDEIEQILLGHRIVNAELGEVSTPNGRAEGILTLDDGTRVYATGNDGGCACDAGCYPLRHLAATDNVITAVRFDDQPDDEYEGGGGWYRIYVVADATEINIASFEGTDGNGYYGTGYSLLVCPS